MATSNSREYFYGQRMRLIPVTLCPHLDAIAVGKNTIKDFPQHYWIFGASQNSAFATFYYHFISEACSLPLPLLCLQP